MAKKNDAEVKNAEVKNTEAPSEPEQKYIVDGYYGGAMMRSDPVGLKKAKEIRKYHADRGATRIVVTPELPAEG